MIREELKRYRLSPQQEYLWLSQQGSDTSFYVQCAILIEGGLDIGRLKSAAEVLVARHEILRTAFRRVPETDAPFQFVGVETGPSWHVEDWSGRDTSAQQDALRRWLEEGRTERFDYERGTLPPLKLAKLEEGTHVLVLRLPALCVDSRGAAILANDLARAYESPYGGVEHDEERLQYGTVAEWLHQLLTSEESEAGRAYWLGRRDAGGAETRLGFEKRPGDANIFSSRSVSVTVEQPLASQLEAAARAHGAAHASLLLSCWVLLLWRLSGQAELSVGFSCDGRSVEELCEAPGLLSRSLPLTLQPRPGWSFAQQLSHVSEQAAEAEAWQERHRDCRGL